MSNVPRAGYGASLLAITGGIVVAAGVAVVTLLRAEPVLQVNVFGIAGEAGRARGAAAEIRPRGPAIALGRFPGDLGIPLAFRAPVGPAGPAVAYAGWTTLGLDPLESTQLDRARRLAQAQPQAAVALYDSILAAQPGNDAVAVERARVLSWSGNTLAAGEALAAVAERRGDPALRVEAARNLYWAARYERADELLDAAPVPAALALRDTVRAADAPSAERARRWVSQRGGAMENTALARALVRERHPAASLAAYRTALRLGARDSLRLEMASAALEADSPSVAAVALGGWLERHPADRATRLQRARALAWAKDYPAASAEYARVLEGRDDAAVRYELAEAQTWAGDSLGARASLERVLGAEPRNARAWRLLGDLDRWAGRWSASLASYERAQAIDPSLEGIGEAVAEDRAGVLRLRQARVAGIPAATARAEGMGDSEGFRYSALEGVRAWVREEDLATLAVRARVERVAGAGPANQGGEGVAVGVDASRPVSRTLRASASAGAEAIEGDVRPALAAQLAWSGQGGAAAALRVVTEPAVRRTATAAAVEAGVVSSRVEASGAARVGGVTVDGAATAERLGARAGSTERVDASVAATRALTPALRVSLSASGLTTRGASPVVEGRTLYWSPRAYLQAQAGAALRHRVSQALELEVRAAPGVAWVDERAAAQRFGGGGLLPALSAGGEARYGTGAWGVVGAVDWSGVGVDGYRSTTVRLGATRAVKVR